MKINMNQMKTLTFILAMGLFTSCGKESKDFTPIGNGFGYVTHVSGFTDRSLSEGLWYQDSTGKRTRVWPYLQMIWGDNIQVTNNIAVLVGGISHVYKEDGVERLSDRLMAFEAPAGPPMDITEQVLQKYCGESGVKRVDVVQDSFHSLTKTNGALEIIFLVLKKTPENTDVHGATMTIQWHDIEAIIQDVKKTGKLKKEKWSGMEYLQKD
jgi:hypothetical protein